MTTLTPVLSVLNGSYDDAYHYVFEVYADEAMSQKVAEATEVAEGTETTDIILTPEFLLASQTILDNTWYTWRAQIKGATASSDWVNGLFFVNTANDAPTDFSIASPASGTMVDTYQPVLTVNNARDVDGDPLLYSFRLFLPGGRSGGFSGG